MNKKDRAKSKKKNDIITIHDEYYDPGYDEDNEFLTIGDGEYYDPDEDLKITGQVWDEYQENMKKGNFLRSIAFRANPYSTQKLNYPTHVVQVGEDECELYDIPQNEIFNVINSIKKASREISERMYCLREEKAFNVTELKVIWYKKANHIISPYFFHSGGTFRSCITWH